MSINWDALGAVAELIAALAVIVSLIYLATQIKSNTEMAKTSTYQSVVSDFGSLNTQMASSPELSALYVQAMEDYDALTAEEKARISQLFFASFHNFENMYYQHRKGYLEEEVWIGWKRLMLTYHSRPGFQIWWSSRSDVYSQSFVDFLRTEKSDVRVASYSEVTRMEKND